MLTVQRKFALGSGVVALAVAALAGIAAHVIAYDKAEDTMVTQWMRDAQRLLSDDGFVPAGAQGTRNAQAAALALAASHFDIVQIYTAGGLLMAEEMSDSGPVLASELPPPPPRSYTEPWFERLRLTDDRALQRVFVPLRGDGDALYGYFEAARLVPAAEHARLQDDALRVGLMTALAALLCGLALFPLALRLNAGTLRRQRELLESHIAMMETLGRAIARCDADGELHNYRVAWIAATLAEAIGLHGRQMEELIVGSFLHDVGKIGLPDHILLKGGVLTEEEMRIMRTHVGVGEDIVGGAGWLGGGQTVVANHHEKWDGSGYPRGECGTDIPLVARIFAIAETFDSLCAKRPYHEALPLKQAVQTLREGAGSHFDPHLVRVFTRQAANVHGTLAEASEEQMHVLLANLVRKHFRL